MSGLLSGSFSFLHDQSVSARKPKAIKFFIDLHFDNKVLRTDSFVRRTLFLLVNDEQLLCQQTTSGSE